MSGRTMLVPRRLAARAGSIWPRRSVPISRRAQSTTAPGNGEEEYGSKPDESKPDDSTKGESSKTEIKISRIRGGTKDSPPLDPSKRIFTDPSSGYWWTWETEQQRRANSGRAHARQPWGAGKHGKEKIGPNASESPESRDKTLKSRSVNASTVNRNRELRKLIGGRAISYEPRDTQPFLSDNLRSILRHVHHPVMVATVHTYQDDDSVSKRPPSLAPVTKGAVKKEGQRSNLIGFAGLTVSSFASVSLAPPKPVISFNIKLPSRTFDLLAQAGVGANSSRRGRFVLHVLSGDEWGAKAAEVFRAGVKTEEEMRARMEAARLELVYRELDFQELETMRANHDGVKDGPHEPPVTSGGGLPSGLKRISLGGQPYLRGPGVICALKCQLLKETGLIPVRDHVLVLAEVSVVLEGEGSELKLEQIQDVENRKDRRTRYREVVVAKDKVGLGYLGRRYRTAGDAIDLEVEGEVGEQEKPDDIPSTAADVIDSNVESEIGEQDKPDHTQAP